MAIKKERNLLECPACGATVLEGSDSCPECLTDLSSIDIPETAQGSSETELNAPLSHVRLSEPLKIERSGLFAAVQGRVLLYIHKEQELDDIARRYPADHYVLIDDKIRILTAVKRVWGDQLTTVFPRQGHFAHAADVASYPAADVTIERIGELTEYDLDALIGAAQGEKRS